MDIKDAFEIVTRTALELSGDQKLALLDAAAAIGSHAGLTAQAEAAANIAASLRAADASEQHLMSLLDSGESESGDGQHPDGATGDER